MIKFMWKDFEEADMMVEKSTKRSAILSRNSKKSGRSDKLPKKNAISSEIGSREMEHQKVSEKRSIK